MKRTFLSLALLAATLVVAPAPARAQETLNINRAAGEITIDGDLSDAGWRDALKFETWYETNPGDNVTPQVKTVGYVSYDDRFFYAAIHSFDPDPASIRAQLGDHDGISGNSDDFAGVLLDTRNDGKTGLELFVTAAGTQFDASLDDTAGNEDASPDLFWDSAVKRTSDGWVVELRVPFSSLRYQKKDPQTWGIMLYRNRPRERRYQIFSNRIPRGGNCLVCNFNKVSGFTGLPSGGHIVAAPYVTAKANSELREDSRSLVNKPAKGDGGLDVKYTPNEHTAIDATINPDFSQVEADVAQISTNERFAINFPEKRPFFLERVDLLTTPIQAVYTRTITSPRWGLRTSGNYGRSSYTALVADDRGGGLAIIPSSTGSHFALQDFGSTAIIGRFRKEIGRNSFISVLATDREFEGGGNNRVFGPDFQWKPSDSNTLTGQLLFSRSETPDRPNVEEEWTGQQLSSYAGNLWFQHSTSKFDFYTEYRDYGDEFRADLGFIPQVGYRMNYAETGRTWRPKGFFNRVRLFGMAEYDAQQDDSMLYRLRGGGFGADGKYRSFLRLQLSNEAFRNNDEVLSRTQLNYQLQFAVSKRIPQVSFDGFVGEDIDFFNNRLGDGARINMNAQIRPTSRLQVSLTNRVRWLSEENDEGLEGRLFTAQVERVRAQYMFTPQMFIRAVVQNQRTSSNPAIYGIDLPTRSGNLSTQFLFAYKVNWQSVLYLGYGDIRDVTEEEIVNNDPTHRNDIRHEFLTTNRQIFFKVSYAFQR